MRIPYLLLAVACLISLACSQNNQITMCTQLNFLPMPKKINCNISNPNPIPMDNPCKILYIINNSPDKKQYSHFVELIEHQQLKTFRCHISHILMGQTLHFKPIGFNYTVNIDVANPELKSSFKTS